MKEKYNYAFGDVTVYDHIKGEISYKYQDNIDEILKVENIIEYLLNSSCTLKAHTISLEKNIKKYNNILKSIDRLWNILSVINIFFIPISAIVSLIIFILLSSSLFLSHIIIGRTNNILEKSLNGHKLELEIINDELIKNREKLNLLYQDKAKTSEKQKEFVKKVNIVEYKEELEKLKEYLQRYFEIGKKLNKYENYHKKNTFDEKVGNDLNESEIKLVKRYLNNNKK